MLEIVSLRTTSRTQLVDITREVEKIVSAASIKTGACLIYVPHTTAAVTINENADPSVADDILAKLNELIPFDGRYRHLEGNAAAHIKSTIVGCSKSIVINGGRLQLGRWQGIFFCEFDGPRSRQVIVKIITDHDE